MVCRPGHENDPLEKLRHSAAHIMASAVQELFPGTRVTIGPVIEEGFFYDFDVSRPFTPEDLKNIEEKMREISRKNLPFQRKVMSREKAIAFFRDKGEPYKVEIIEGLPEGEEISLYQHGDWVDLCKGPHVETTGGLKAFKLLQVAGAYWRGSEKNKMLQRIYGTAFLKKEELDDYLKRRQEADERDHRKLGKRLDFFSTMDEQGAGLVLWHPKGARVRKVIEDFWREEHQKGGYEILYTPHVARRDLWKTSGHLDFYKEYLFGPMEMEGIDYQLKPMNCPFHIQIYKSSLRSYRDLPFRWAELGTVYRYERSGVLHGLLRVRGFTQDDAHIFCRPDQLKGEIVRVLEFTLGMLKTFGFESYEVLLSTRPEKYVGSVEDWERATAALKEGLLQKKIPFEVDPGEGVFYGPKIDIKIKDVLGRKWQCSTIQVDFNLPERFGLEYINEKGERSGPVMVHRALLGSLERFFGVLIEHYAGAFPAWLAPVQAVVITVSEGQEAYAREVEGRLKTKGFRVDLDVRGEKLGGKIRDAELQRVPYMLIIGKKEAESGAVSVRSRQKGDLGSMEISRFVEKLEEEVQAKK